MGGRRIVEGKLIPMAQVQGFSTEAIRLGVRAFGFLTVEVEGAPWMVANLAVEPLTSAVARAAAAAIVVDKMIALQPPTTPASQARTALMLRLFRSPATEELAAYQDLLIPAVTQRVADAPARLLDALAEPDA